jgi:hypothetical protein
LILVKAKIFLTNNLQNRIQFERIIPKGKNVCKEI